MFNLKKKMRDFEIDRIKSTWKRYNNINTE